MQTYRSHTGPPSPARAPASTSRQSRLGYQLLGIPSDFNVLQDDNLNWPNAGSGAALDREYKAYINGARTDIDIDLPKFWEVRILFLFGRGSWSDSIDYQQHMTDFPTVFQIAMDHLPIQASSVPCERAFSSSAETDTARRNRLSPILMEALQMLKFALKTDGLNFTTDLLTPEEDLVLRKEPNPGLLGSLSSTSREDEREDFMDSIVRAIE